MGEGGGSIDSEVGLLCSARDPDGQNAPIVCAIVACSARAASRACDGLVVGLGASPCRRR